MRPAKPKSPGPDRRSAFSLVEVTMAIGIFAFAIVAVIGLLAVSMNSDKAAASDSVLALMTQDVTARLRGQPFATLAALPGYADTDLNPDFYYSMEGSLTPVTHADAYYSCRVARRATASPNLDCLSLEFRWPKAVPTAQQSSRFVTLSVARYD